MASTWGLWSILGECVSLDVAIFKSTIVGAADYGLETWNKDLFDEVCKAFWSEIATLLINVVSAESAQGLSTIARFILVCAYG